jgi:hypothetical protein
MQSVLQENGHHAAIAIPISITILSTVTSNI